MDSAAFSFNCCNVLRQTSGVSVSNRTPSLTSSSRDMNVDRRRCPIKSQLKKEKNAGSFDDTEEEKTMD
ncbi:hypothetical protein DICVIV_10449 [Dictyocaulus viviparus]|uniref:Uncharacterized protein n=1 Tax=Dictyocaulus viviparus TaxID=29172 RepID=A0A0D8XG11_DICVI|nr:hypothetical protein DICVIV_10449 [Dictyocaulus viviparus]